LSISERGRGKRRRAAARPDGGSEEEEGSGLATGQEWREGEMEPVWPFPFSILFSFSLISHTRYLNAFQFKFGSACVQDVPPYVHKQHTSSFISICYYYC
jgi:hypothetical protein